MSGPRRRVDDHFHPDYWTVTNQHRFEDDLKEELKLIRAEVKDAGNRLTYLFGGLAVVAFILPIAAPFVRSLFNIGP